MPARRGIFRRRSSAVTAGGAAALSSTHVASVRGSQTSTGAASVAGTATASIAANTGVQRMTRSGANLQVNGVTKRFSGLNAYWLGLDDNQGESPGTYPSKTQISNAFTGMVEMGATLVRAHTVGMSAGTSMSFETAPGTFVNANLDSADYAVYQAAQKGIYLSTPLTDNWNYYHGGKWNFVHWAYQQNSSGITDTPGSIKDDVNERQFYANTTAGLRIRQLFKDYISAWLNHVNPYTGLAYKDDPTIAIVETGNELYAATAEWTQDIASYIKNIAPNKLVMDGAAADRVFVSNAPGLNASSVDILAAHYYPQQQSGSYPPVPFGDSSSGYTAGTALAQIDADSTAAANAGKPFIIGEYPWTRADVAAYYSKVEGNSAIDADMPWTYVANTDGGTPLTHGGAFGSDDFSVHRPYANASEQTYAPALARHIVALSGRAASNGAATEPAAATNLIASPALRNASDASLFTAGSATLSTDTSIFKSGGSSLKVTPSGSGVYPYFYFTTPSQGAPVTPGSQYTGFASFRTSTATTQGMQAVLVWFKSDGSYISGSTGAYTSAVQGSWVQASMTDTAPANAAYAVVQLQSGSAVSASDVMYVDEYGITAGTSTVWSSGASGNGTTTSSGSLAIGGGASSSSSATAVYTENWTGTTNAAWPASWTTGGDVAPVIQNNQGKLQASTSQSYRSAFGYGGGFSSVTNFNMLVQFVVSDSAEQAIVIGNRATGTNRDGGNSAVPTTGVVTYIDSGSVQLMRCASSGFTQLANVGFTLTTGTWMVRFIGSGTSLSVKIWLASGSEPSSPTATSTDSATPTNVGNPWLGYRGGPDSVGRYVLFDNLSVSNA